MRLHDFRIVISSPLNQRTLHTLTEEIIVILGLYGCKKVMIKERSYFILWKIPPALL